ncbi:MAG: hypothetical protein LIO87_06070, partial [Eubacterium sp.]|nr:hypothetical protein [Eubacterium sp.]
ICVEIPNKLVDIFETGKLNISFKDDLTVLTKIYDVSGNFTTDADYYYVLNCTQSGSAEEAADQTQATSVSESDESNATDKTEADTTPLNIGETIVTDNYEFTLNNVELTYEVKPSDTSSVYSSYTADDGKVYIDVSGSYYNTSKKDACVRDLPKASADYDNGYTYSGFAAVDTGNSFDWVSSYVICTPLETCRYHCIIECPEIVNSSDSSLYVLLPLADSNTYKYVIR